MRLYEMFASVDQPGRFAAATGFGPIPNMWFIGAQFWEQRQVYWKVNPTPPGLSIEENAKTWPDFLENADSPPMFFVSNRVVDSLLSINAPMGRITEMPIGEIDAKELKNKPAPKYYIVETFPGIEVDLEATGFKTDANGRAILKPRPNPWPAPYRFRRDSWNGADLFAFRYFGPTDGPYVDMLCTERVKELAEKDGWKGVRFEPLILV